MDIDHRIADWANFLFPNGFNDPVGVLRRLDKQLDWSFGVESVKLEENEYSETWYYLNSGETYKSTVAYNPYDDKMEVTSWGAIVESEEQEYEAENDCQRCGYCGEFTPHNYDEEAGETWRDTKCDSCGNFLGG